MYHLFTVAVDTAVPVCVTADVQAVTAAGEGNHIITFDGQPASKPVRFLHGAGRDWAQAGRGDPAGKIAFFGKIPDAAPAGFGLRDQYPVARHQPGLPCTAFALFRAAVHIIIEMHLTGPGANFRLVILALVAREKAVTTALLFGRKGRGTGQQCGKRECDSSCFQFLIPE